MKNSQRRLTNRFGGNAENINIEYADKNIAEGIANHMTIIVKNNHSTNALPFAIIPANFDTLRAKVTSSQSSIAVDLEENNCAEMQKAGFNISGVAHDGSYSDTEKGVDYAVESADPARTIKNFLRYIKLNPSRLKSMEIVAANANAFDTNMQLTYVNPFFKNAMQNIDLSTFYSLYQEATDRVRIDFANNNVELNDLSLLTAVIPANTTMKFILRFA